MRGAPLPYGVTKDIAGYNFSLFSKQATGVSLCLFDNNKQPLQEISLNPKINKTGDIWHISICDLSPDFLYGYRLTGPYDPFKGLYYDNRHIVLDPFTKQVVSNTKWGEKHFQKNIHLGVIDPLNQPFDWQEDTHPNIPLKELIIYEMHVRGFTQDSSSGVKHPGTLLGLIEKIPYLKSLGINAVELLPIYEFGERMNPRINPTTKEPLYNYWGYSTVNFFSLMNRYTTDLKQGIHEFKTLVKELHANGIEVILDVVYNHTAEGNSEGPLLSFKGIENSSYYILGPNGEYYDFTGCGNTFNANQPVVRELIRESIRYWVKEMHVDGFRFDLASALTRSTNGTPLGSPPLIEALTLDPLLANTKLIAEAWDAGGLYQVGTFPSWGVWAEWNGKYRDDVREFIKGTDGKINIFATRLCGSQDLYGKGRSPFHSINFVTCHDGFTLKDLVSYNGKHNEANGEDNKDGDNNNLSWNCGYEGETTDRKTLILRQRQMRNFLLTMLTSQGVPMILMGDEYGHTKNGNNNTWCQDGPINWFLWNKLEEEKGLVRFISTLIHFRNAHPVLHQAQFLSQNEVAWHGKKANAPDWTPQSRFIAMTLADGVNNFDLYIAFNPSFKSAAIELPQPREGQAWFLIADTSKACPNDIIEEKDAKPLAGLKYRAHPYSSLIFKSKPHTS